MTDSMEADIIPIELAHDLRAGVDRLEVAREAPNSDVFLRSRRVWSVTMADLGVADLRLNQSLVVMIEEFDLEFVAAWPEVEAWGAGGTESEALNELKDDIVRLYRDLEAESEPALGELPRRWRMALRAVITRSQSEGAGR